METSYNSSTEKREKKSGKKIKKLQEIKFMMETEWETLN